MLETSNTQTTETRSKIYLNTTLPSEDEFLEILKIYLKKTFIKHSSYLLQDMLLDHFAVQGKLIRPRIIYRLGSLLNIPINRLLSWASCCEMFHNATLIHDDFQDADVYRRGRETTWFKYGANQAINAGDLLMIISPYSLLSINDLNVQNNLLNLFTKTAAKIVQGQNLEFQLNQLNNDLELRSTYMKCISWKTSALFSALAEGVAILANLPKSHQQILGEIFNTIGNIFQIQDDILDLFGNKQRDSIGCDIKEGKVSFLIVKYLESFPEEISEIKMLLHTPRDKTPLTDIYNFRDRLINKGILEACLEELRAIIIQLQTHPFLREFKIYQPVIMELINKILIPINHIDKDNLLSPQKTNT